MKPGKAKDCEFFLFCHLCQHYDVCARVYTHTHTQIDGILIGRGDAINFRIIVKTLGPEGDARSIHLGGSNGVIISLLNNHPELGVSTSRDFNKMEMTWGDSF